MDKLYRGIERNLTVPFRFVCFCDEDYRFYEPVQVLPLELPCRNMFSLLEPFREDLGRVLFMGLDTVIVGNIDDIAGYSGPFAMTRDPNNPKIGCSGVMAFPHTPQIWQDVKENLTDRMGRYTMANCPSDMIYLNSFPHEYLDDHFAGIYSYKVHIKRQRPDDARIVYFHGREKPHEIEEDFVTRHWV